MTEADLRDQFLKAFPIDSRGSGFSLVRVDYDDAFERPSQTHRLLPQVVLPLRAFGVFEDLPQRRLPNVEIGIAPQVLGGHLGMNVPREAHEADSFLGSRIMSTRTRVISSSRAADAPAGADAAGADAAGADAAGADAAGADAAGADAAGADAAGAVPGIAGAATGWVAGSVRSCSADQACIQATRPRHLSNAHPHPPEPRSFRTWRRRSS